MITVEMGQPHIVELWIPMLGHVLDLASGPFPRSQRIVGYHICPPRDTVDGGLDLELTGIDQEGGAIRQDAIRKVPATRVD